MKGQVSFGCQARISTHKVDDLIDAIKHIHSDADVVHVVSQADFLFLSRRCALQIHSNTIISSLPLLIRSYCDACVEPY